MKEPVNENLLHASEGTAEGAGAKATVLKSQQSTSESAKSLDVKSLDSRAQSKEEKDAQRAKRNAEDSEWVRAFRAGDQTAFRKLFDRYFGRIYGFAYNMLHNQEEARDVAQEAFVRVHKHIHDFILGSSFSTWIHRIASNLSIDVLRRRSVRNASEYDDTRPPDDSGVFDWTDADSAYPNPDRSALRKELQIHLSGALEKLPPLHREILLLREIDGLSYEELSDALEVPLGTVMSRLFHARKKMQKILADYLEGKDDRSGTLGLSSSGLSGSSATFLGKSGSVDGGEDE